MTTLTFTIDASDAADVRSAQAMLAVLSERLGIAEERANVVSLRERVTGEPDEDMEYDFAGANEDLEDFEVDEPAPAPSKRTTAAKALAAKRKARGKHAAAKPAANPRKEVPWKAKARKLLAKGNSQKAVAEAVGVSRSSVATLVAKDKLAA